MAYALGPYILQKLDLDRGELTTLVEEHGHDHLLPRMAADGTLYFLRRPYQPYGPPVSPLKVLGDTILFPFRLIRAVVHFLDFFSQMFSRKPLITAGGPPREAPQSRYLMLWGKMIDTEKAMRVRKGDKPGAVVPSTWQLIRRRPGGAEEVLAKSTLSYDLCTDGSLVYTNGSTVIQRMPDGQTRELCAGRIIECVSAVG